MTEFLKNPDHWRERAEETRTKAERFFFDERQKQKLLRIAAEYDQLADRAARWLTVAEAEKPPWLFGTGK